MKLYVFVIFIVTQTVLSEKAVSKLRRKLIIPKINDDCRKIKCSSVEEPACARLRRHDLKTTFHIIVVNKCELDYIKCHDDVEAKLVPMKFCGHAKESKASKKQNKTGAAHRRVKRYVRRTTSTKDKNHTGAIQDNKKPEVKAGQQWKNEAYNSILSDHEAPVNDVKINRIDRNLKRRGNRYTSDSNSDTEQNERKKLGKGISGHPIDIVEPHALQSIDEPNFKIPLQNMKMEMKSVNINDRGNEDFDIMQSEESVNNTNAALLEIDKEEYKEMCPSVCPSRDVMVCAKCQHGIYKTFVSVCHMRMFSCYHSDEVLELISRYPCVLSAPYISEPEMKPVGRISEPADEDPVLKYIMCRDRGMLGGPQDDDRCNFKENNKHLYKKKNAIVQTFPPWFEDASHLSSY